MTPEIYDLISVDRANLDLFSQDIGASFEDITGFDAIVGGSPTNIAIGLSRLAMRSALLGAVGDDRVGDFVLRFLRDEGVGIDYITRKPGKLTSLALLGVQPPSQFPLSFYREDPADIYLDGTDVAAVDFTQVRAVLVSGNALSRGPCAAAAKSVAEICSALPADVYMDLDLRPTEWATPESFGKAVRATSELVDVTIGTEEEYYGALMDDPETVSNGASVPRSRRDDLEAATDDLVGRTPSAIVIKRGERGATVLTAEGRLDVPGFNVEVVNTVGVGDSFAAGLIRSRLRGLDWEQSLRFANACGAIVVTRHGCSLAFPREDEVMDLVATGRPR